MRSAHKSKLSGILIFLILAGAAFLLFETVGKSSGLKFVKGSDTEAIYDSLYEKLKDHETSVTFFSSSDIDQEVLNGTYDRVMADHPEFFWLDGSGQWMIGGRGVAFFYTFTPGTIVDMEEVTSMEADLEAAVSPILAEAEKRGSDYDKAQYVHDTLVNLCDYDMSVYEDTAENDLTYTAYGCLVSHSAVCEGYARAYQLLMNRLGITCTLISGTAVSTAGSGSHAWNSVVLNGITYYVDVTWDDPVGGDPSSVRHDYFALTADQIGKNHFAAE